MIQCRALTALHTLTPIVSVTDLGDKRNLVMVWNSLYIMASDKKPGIYIMYHGPQYTHVLLHTVQSDDEYLEALTAAQLAILEKLSSVEQSAEV